MVDAYSEDGFVRHSDLFGFTLPDDFPLEPLESLHQRITTAKDAQPEFWSEWASGLNGVLYRFIGCARYDEALQASLGSAGTSPPLDDRVEQEQALYGFFVSGQSSLECLGYALYFAGSIVDASAFPLTKTPEKIWLRSTAGAYGACFADEPLAETLAAVSGSPEFRGWWDVRNVLTHRAAPGRTHSETLAAASGTSGSSTRGQTTWLGQSLGPDTTTRPRAWLSDCLSQIVSTADGFVASHLPAPDISQDTDYE